jgi:hypothetical protein
MERKKKINLTRRVTIRLKPEEYSKIHSKFKSTTKRKLSEDIRAVLLEKPLTVFTRSKSLDDFISEMILLRSELNSIGNNFNQSVKRLHTLDKIPDIKTWAILNEKSKEILIKKVDEIKEKINQISDKWLQE